MYIPYVRGKQFELLALKEYASALGASGVVRPIIEPIKNPNDSGGLRRCLESLIEVGVEPGVVVNPQVGELSENATETILSFLNDLDPEGTRIDAVVLVHQDTNPVMFDAVIQAVPETRRTLICHVGKNASLEDMGSALDESITQHIIPADARTRVYRKAFPGARLSVLSDGFPAQSRNADYLPVAASEFSDDFLYYREDGFEGFGDYLTVGSGWQEGGFTPRAVAIHWTYQERVGGPVMIRHFVSTTNGDISNVGRKYLEAAEKLVAFLPEALFETKAAEVFRESLRAASYPGLGIVKKLSMQNHLEVMMRAIKDS